MNAPPADGLLQLVFTGECLEGHDPQAVRRAVAQALKLDEPRAARLFSGQRVVLRRELDVARAHRHVARFASLGALVRIEPSAPRPKDGPTPGTARGADRGARAGARGAGTVPTDGQPTTPADADAAATGDPSTGAPPPTAGDTSADAWTTARVASRSSAPVGARAVAELQRFIARTDWPRPLVWAGHAGMFVAVTLLLLVILGPGMNALWSDVDPPEPTAPLVAPPATGAGAQRAPSPPTPSPAPPLTDPPRTMDVQPPPPSPAAPTPTRAGARSEVPGDVSAEILRVRETSYLNARNHKALAISSGGAHGWHAGAATENEARERALATCMRALRPGDDGCRVVDADGQWLE